MPAPTGPRQAPGAGPQGRRQVSCGYDSTVIEAKDLEDLAAQLRERYPDETFERFLRQERDVEAERRKAEAMDGLIQLLAETVVEDIFRQETEPS